METQIPPQGRALRRLAMAALLLAALALAGCGSSSSSSDTTPSQTPTNPGDTPTTGTPTFALTAPPTVANLTDLGSGAVQGDLTLQFSGSPMWATAVCLSTLCDPGNPSAAMAAGEAVSGASATLTFYGLLTATGAEHRVHQVVLFSQDPSTGTVAATIWNVPDNTTATYSFVNVDYVDGQQPTTLPTYGTSDIAVGTFTW